MNRLCSCLFRASGGFNVQLTRVRFYAGSRTPLKAKSFGAKTKNKHVIVQPKMTVRQLAVALDKSLDHIIDCLQYVPGGRNIQNENAVINYEAISKVAKLCGCHPTLQKRIPSKDELKELQQLEESDVSIAKRSRPDPKVLVKRSPIVTIMGHVDHGKTTLLDALRNSNVVATEFGGITQHIGAFNCKLGTGDKNGTERTITFLDTPGHAAFISMRERGAKCTDIVVLVVAADDGVMAQTVECIEIIKQSGCPIILAINKIDKADGKEGARKLKLDLIKYGIQTEDMGGNVQCVEISALKKLNIDTLKEEIWALAEVLELKGDPNGLLEGYVIESFQDPQRGKLATVIISRGTMKKASYLVSGLGYCKVKQMFDEKKSSLNEAQLSQAVQVMGWRDYLPKAGDEVIEVSTENEAKKIVEIRQRKEEIRKENADLEEITRKRDEHEKQYKELLKKKHNTGLIFMKTFKATKREKELKEEDTGIKTLSIIIKSDVDGTLEAILDVLDKYNSNDKVKLNLIGFGVGPITQSDLDMANMFNGIIYSFNIDSKLPSTVDESIVYKIKHFNIIYRLFDDVKEEIQKLAPLVETENVVGQAEIAQTFEIDERKSKIKVAGGRCVDGVLNSKFYFRLIRDHKLIVDKQTCRSLKHFKTDVNTIKKGTEFGFSFDDNEIKIEKGDKLICYELKMVPDVVDCNFGF